MASLSKLILVWTIFINLPNVYGLTVYSPYRGSMPFDQPLTTTVCELKQHISAHIEIPIHSFYLSFGQNQILNDDLPLTHYNIQNDSILTLHRRRTTPTRTRRQRPPVVAGDNPNSGPKPPPKPKKHKTKKYKKKKSKASKIGGYKFKHYTKKDRKRRQIMRRRRRLRRLRWQHMIEWEYRYKLNENISDPFSIYIKRGRINYVDLNNTDFVQLFDVFDNLVFGGMLQNVTVQWKPVIWSDTSAAGIYDAYSNSIYLSQALLRHESVSNLNRIETMLHEMVHAFLHINNIGGAHGIYFRAIINVLNDVLGLNITVSHTHRVPFYALLANYLNIYDMIIAGLLLLKYESDGDDEYEKDKEE